MENRQRVRSHRPHWQVDAKWVCGLLFTFFFSITFLLYNLVELTAFPSARKALSAVVGLSEIGRVLDSYDPGLAKLALDDPQGMIRLPQFLLQTSLRPEEFLRLSKEELKQRLVEEWSQRIYTEGLTTGFEHSRGLDPEAIGLKVASLFSRHSNQRLQTLFLLFSIPSALFGALLILFSRGAGKLVSAGLALSFAGLPLFLLLLAFTFIAMQLAAEESDPFLRNLLGLFAELVRTPLQNYTILLILGTSLFWIGVAGSLIRFPLGRGNSVS